MQKQIIIGTKNQAKVLQIQGALKPIKVSVIGLPKDLKLDIKEDGLTAQENAKKKAVAYAKFLGRQVLSMDNALYFDGLPNELQPGINVRRIQGKEGRPTDSELLEYYSKLIWDNFGEKITGRWEFAVCIADSDRQVHETTIISPRVFKSKASHIVIEGYPLESIQIDPATGKYISEMAQDEQDQFWQNAIGRQLCNFVKNVLDS